MKKIQFILLFITLISLEQSYAQNNTGFRNYKGEFIKRFKFGLGWGYVETDQKPLYMFDAFGGWKGGGFVPKTFAVDYRFDPKIRLNLGVTKSNYFIRTVDTAGTASYNSEDGYFGVDLNVLYNFRAFKHQATLRKTWTLRNLHKEKMYFDGYFLGGLGVYNPIVIPTLNTGVGGDFWITYRWGINVQTVAKWSMDKNQLFHMNHSFGIVFHVDQGNDAGALNTLRRRNKKRKKVKKAVIHEKYEGPVGEDGDSSDDEDFEDFTE